MGGFFGVNVSTIRKCSAHNALRHQGCNAHPSWSRRTLLTFPSLLPMVAFPWNPATAASRLTIEEVESRLKQCFEENEYYVSGNLDRGIFDKNCVFKDPTINVKGVVQVTRNNIMMHANREPCFELLSCLVRRCCSLIGLVLASISLGVLQIWLPFLAWSSDSERCMQPSNHLAWFELSSQS
jgi:hypothetical protein